MEKTDSAPQSAGEQKLIRAAFIVGAMTVLSRILGLWRFRLMARIFGATEVADAFNFAFIFPNLTRRLFGEGLLTSAFVPVFSDRIATDKRDEANKTASILLMRLTYWLSFGTVCLIVLSAAARMILPRVMHIEEHYVLQLKLFETMLPYCVLINVASVLMGILNSLGHFWMPAFAPVLLNVFIIAACYFALPWFGSVPETQIWAVAFAVLLGGIAQLVVQLPPAFARGFRFIPRMNTDDPGYQEVMNNFKPVVLMVAVFQINTLLDNIIAQVFIANSGPVTYLNMGTSIYQLPWSVFSLALGTAALPALAALWAQSRKQDFTRTLLSSLRLTIFLAIPCTVGIVLLSEDLVRLLYGAGKFLDNDAEPVRRTAGVAMFASLGLVFFSVNALLARALYAMKDMRTPTTTSAKSVAINVALNLFFVLVCPLMARAALPANYLPMGEWTAQRVVYELGNLREGGIALASVLSNAWQTWALARTVRERSGGKTGSQALFIAQIIGGAGVSCVTAMLAYQYLMSRPDQESIFAFFGAVAGGIIPFLLFGKLYFGQVFKHVPDNKRGELHRLTIPEEYWTEEVKFQYSIYTTIIASAIMGFGVWAVRDSLPPEGRTFIQIFQRATVPVVAGIMIYSMAASGFLAREHEELRNALSLRFGKKPATA